MIDTTHHTTLPKRLIAAVAGIALIVALGAAAITTYSAEAQENSQLDDGQHLLSEAEITPEEAIEIALGEIDGHVEDVDLERQGSQLVYEIEIDDTDVDVDAMDGTVLHIDYDDDARIRSDATPNGQQGQDRSSSSDADRSSNDTGSKAGEPAISADEAVEIAQGEVSGTVEDVELERENGHLVYEVEINDTDVYVDANDGSVLYIDHDDDDDDDDDRRLSNGVEVDDEARDADPQISGEEAIAIAQNEVDGKVDDVELEREGGRLVYEIEVGEHDVYVDANDGTVLHVEYDD